jgi:UDP-glucose 4-epimerase
MKTTIIVTGAAGFIGSHTCDRLLVEGHRVIGVDDLSSGRAANLEDASRDPCFAFERFDLRAPGRFSALVETARPAAIIHLAGLVSVQASIRDPRLNFSLNLELTHLVAEAAREQAVPRVVFASSAAVYGDFPHLPLREDIAPQPLTPYGAAKAASEQLLLGHARTYGFTVRCQRYFNVFGPRQDPASPYSGVIAIFLDRMQAGRSPVIYGDGGQTRDFVAVQDVARANVLAATRPGLASGVVNICSGRSTRLNDLAADLAAATGFGGPVTHAGAKPGDIRHSAGDPGHAREQLGFACEWSLAGALAALAHSTRPAVAKS